MQIGRLSHKAQRPRDLCDTTITTITENLVHNESMWPKLGHNGHKSRDDAPLHRRSRTITSIVPGFLFSVRRKCVRFLCKCRMTVKRRFWDFSTVGNIVRNYIYTHTEMCVEFPVTTVSLLVNKLCTQSAVVVVDFCLRNSSS